eukprot:gene34202-182_t
MTPYGSAHMHTPNLHRLASRSMLFSRAYVQVALCMPSRTALLTSRRPDTSMDWTISPKQWPRTCGGVCGGNDCGNGCGIPGLVTLPQWFKEHGFYTVGMGKIFHEGADTQLQDYRFSWTTSTTNPQSGVWEAKGGPQAIPSWYAFDVDDDEMTETMLAEHA